MADVGSDAVSDIEKGAVVPERVAGFTTEGFSSRLGLENELTQCENQRV